MPGQTSRANELRGGQRKGEQRDMPTTATSMPGREDSEKDLASSSNRDLASVLQKGGIASPSTISRLIKMGSSLKREHLLEAEDLDEEKPKELTMKEKFLFWAIDAPGVVLFSIWCLHPEHQGHGDYAQRSRHHASGEIRQGARNLHLWHLHCDRHRRRHVSGDEEEVVVVEEEEELIGGRCPPRSVS
eukprot:746251-Hanusia_phi.AAC.2